MPMTEAQMQAFLDDLNAICEKHQVEISFDTSAEQLAVTATQPVQGSMGPYYPTFWISYDDKARRYHLDSDA